MSTDYDEFGISPEQGPPLSVPFSFFLTAPIAILAAGVLLFFGNGALQARATEWTIGLTHLGTLGFLGAVMMGAMYQMLPVVAGATVRPVRLSHLVHLALVVGLVALVWGFMTSSVGSFAVAWVCLVVAFVLFLVPVGLALLRSPVRDATVAGMSLALAGLAAVVAIGVVMARTRAGAAYADNWIALFNAHVTLGAIVWTGGLITAVSWQVIPMFYLTGDYPRASRRTVLLGVAITGAGAVIIPWIGVGAEWIVLAAAPGGIAVWLVHPWVSVRLLRQRRRRRVDDSVRFWFGGLLCAPVAFALAIATWLLPDLCWAVLLGWTLIWGWAGMIVHGMLTRISAFLVWFHRYAPVVGQLPVPPMRRLFPARQARVELVAHVATLVCGWAAIASGSQWLASLTGVGLVFTGGALFVGLARVTLHLRGAASYRTPAPR